MNDYTTQYALRKERKANFMCVQCGGYLDREGIYCIRCNSLNRISKLKFRQKKIAARKCLCCNKDMDRKGLFCNKCIIYYRTLARARNAYRRDNGLCVQCGAAADGYSYCQRCRDMRMDRHWKKVNEVKKRA